MNNMRVSSLFTVFSGSFFTFKPKQVESSTVTCTRRVPSQICICAGVSQKKGERLDVKTR